MPEQLPAAEPRVTGEDILSEVVRNMEAGLFRIRYTTLVPAVFRVYLHPEDFEPIRGALPFLSAEIKRSLAEKLAAWNARPGLLQRLAGGASQRTEYKLLADDWTVEFYPETEGKLQRGDIEIFSELGAAPKPEYGVGSMTRRITRRDAGGRTSSREEPAAAAAPFFARIRYEDTAGAHEYSVTSDQVVIGRGGKAYWVDLRLEAPPDVSREHCRLRRDPASGRFYIKDVSQFGTSVNGQAVPSSIAVVDGKPQDSNIEVPLPDKARIGLANMIFLDFERQGQT